MFFCFVFYGLIGFRLFVFFFLHCLFQLLLRFCYWLFSFVGFSHIVCFAWIWMKGKDEPCGVASVALQIRMVYGHHVAAKNV